MKQGSLFDDEDVPGTLLSDARRRLFDSPEFYTPGGRHACPCCDQNVKARNRRLSRNIAGVLCWLVHRWEQTRDYVELQRVAPRHFLRDREWSRLTLPPWGLIEAKPNEDPDKKDSGMYQPTERGLAFAYGRLRVPSHLRVYNNAVLEVSEESLDVFEAIAGGPFSYAELMGRSEPMEPEE